MIVRDFHFKPILYNSSVWDYWKQGYISDLKEVLLNIRIIGTQEQIEIKCVEYIKRNKLQLDEIYDFKVHQPTDYWYRIFGEDAEKENVKTRKKIKEYKKMYKENNNQAIIIRI